MFTARYHGVDLNVESLRLRPDEPAPSPPVLVEWLRDAGLWARGVPMNFRQLMKVDDPAPIVLLLDDGGAAMVVGREPGKRNFAAARPAWRCRMTLWWRWTSCG